MGAAYLDQATQSDLDFIDDAVDGNNAREDDFMDGEAEFRRR